MLVSKLLQRRLVRRGLLSRRQSPTTTYLTHHLSMPGMLSKSFLLPKNIFFELEGPIMIAVVAIFFFREGRLLTGGQNLKGALDCGVSTSLGSPEMGNSYSLRLFTRQAGSQCQADFESVKHLGAYKSSTCSCLYSELFFSPLSLTPGLMLFSHIYCVFSLLNARIGA